MDVYIYNKNYELVAVCDDYESLIWNVKYNDVGDFELCVPANSVAVKYLREDYYIEIEDSDRTMIIEKYEPLTDAENGNTIVYSGRSLESILDRRIIWNQTVVSGKTGSAIQNLFDSCFGSNASANRKVANFYIASASCPNIGSTIENTMFTGDELLEAVKTLSQNDKLGFYTRILTYERVNKLPLKPDLKTVYVHPYNGYILEEFWDISLNQYVPLNPASSQIPENQYTGPNHDFIILFGLYNGANRTMLQDENSYIEFSLNNDNLFTAKRSITKQFYKNVTLIAGEGEGSARRTQVYPVDADTTSSTISGLDRREYYTDARDISSNKGQSNAINDTTYNKLLLERGKSKLSELSIKREMEAEVDTSEEALFIFQEDYFIGDLVECVDYFGEHFVSRIKEATIHADNKGCSCYPIFEQEEIINEGE